MLRVSLISQYRNLDIDLIGVLIGSKALRTFIHLMAQYLLLTFLLQNKEISRKISVDQD